ncbi:MAG: Nitrogen regulatory protein P-II [Clostridiales bacterium 38_11]|nr:MAG: Nitrogen regulatory protein P-II [Clostridiales bacterium 38_11]HBH12747.1 P-II family nitrogen regulator [Clostridiales bacterium]
MSEIYTKIEIITRPSKLEELKDALMDIGVEGMTVSNVLGSGKQKGHTTKYRGADYTALLLPKIKIEVVVCKTPVEKVVETAQSICRTGKIGDGKIFIYRVDNIYRIRTGESGSEAIN